MQGCGRRLIRRRPALAAALLALLVVGLVALVAVRFERSWPHTNLRNRPDDTALCRRPGDPGRPPGAQRGRVRRPTEAHSLQLPDRHLGPAARRWRPSAARKPAPCWPPATGRCTSPTTPRRWSGWRSTPRPSLLGRPDADRGCREPATSCLPTPGGWTCRPAMACRWSVRSDPQPAAVRPTLAGAPVLARRRRNRPRLERVAAAYARRPAAGAAGGRHRQEDLVHPVHGAYPTSRWQPGEVVADDYLSHCCRARPPTACRWWSIAGCRRAASKTWRCWTSPCSRPVSRQH